MCQVNDDEEFQSLKSTKIERKCMSCDQDAVVVVRIGDPLCRQCFEEYFLHKFRSTLSKSKIFDKGERVLIGYSGGSSSTALIHLIHDGLSLRTKKRILLEPHVVFIDETCLYENVCSKLITDKVTELVSTKLGYPLHILPLNQNFNEDECDLNEYIRSTKSLTAREELVRRLKLNLLIETARKEQCSKLLLADNCTKLAAQILSDMCNGKGAHVAFECSLIDTRSDEVTIVRPFREIMAKEIVIYNRLNSIEPVTNYDISTMNGPQSSIYQLTETLINDLQRQFPSTISTIFRTSDKIDKNLSENNSERSHHLCKMCQCIIDLNDAESGVDNDYKIRKLFSNTLTTDKQSDENKEENLLHHNSDERFNVCYACRRLLKDLPKSQTITNGHL